MWVLASTPQGEEYMSLNFLVSWDAVAAGRYWTLITSEFSHNLLWHFLLNMLVFQNFGVVLESVLGSSRFFVFYLLAAFGSSLCHCIVSKFILADPSLAALGASGAVSGIVLLFSFIFPKERIYLLGIIPLPAIVGALAFIGLDLWGLSVQVGGHGLPIGHGAHLGGAFTGILYYFLYVRPRLRQASITQAL